MLEEGVGGGEGLNANIIHHNRYECDKTVRSNVFILLAKKHLYMTDYLASLFLVKPHTENNYLTKMSSFKQIKRNRSKKCIVTFYQPLNWATRKISLRRGKSYIDAGIWLFFKHFTVPFFHTGSSCVATWIKSASKIMNCKVLLYRTTYIFFICSFF